MIALWRAHTVHCHRLLHDTVHDANFVCITMHCDSVVHFCDFLCSVTRWFRRICVLTYSSFLYLHNIQNAIRQQRAAQQMCASLREWLHQIIHIRRYWANTCLKCTLLSWLSLSVPGLAILVKERRVVCNAMYCQYKCLYTYAMW